MVDAIHNEHGLIPHMQPRPQVLFYERTSLQRSISVAQQGASLLRAQLPITRSSHAAAQERALGAASRRVAEQQLPLFVRRDHSNVQSYLNVSPPFRSQSDHAALVQCRRSRVDYVSCVDEREESIASGETARSGRLCTIGLRHPFG